VYHGAAVRIAILIVLCAGCASGKSGADDDDTTPIDAPAGPIVDAADQHIDSGGGTPDAQPIGAPDANPIAPDANEPPPDANPACTPITQQKLTNANFDGTPLGNGWVQIPQDASYPPIVTPTDLSLAGITAQSPQNAVWLGGLLSSTDALYQQFAVPADATNLQIRFYKWFASEETVVNQDFLRVQIRSTGNAVLETVATMGNPTTAGSDTAWVQTAILAPTGSYAGQTIRFYLESTTNAANNTNFFVDTTTFTVVACP
jgi:hypothetical protein